MELNITTLITVGGFLIAVASLLINIIRGSKKDDKETAKDIQGVLVRVAILEERSVNEIKILEKLDEKLDKIEEKI